MLLMECCTSPLLLLLLLQICAVFAQLTVGGVWQGPHVFMVRIRDDKGEIMPGWAAFDFGFSFMCHICLCTNCLMVMTESMIRPVGSGRWRSRSAVVRSVVV
jgi:hypothetical protein